jgi:hypothetical protein
MLKLSELRVEFEQITTVDGMHDERAPSPFIDFRTGVLDGLLASERDRRTALQIDLFGNVVGYEQALRELDAEKLTPDKIRFGFGSASSGTFAGCHGEHVIERIMATLLIARQFYFRVGFYGPLSVSVIVEDPLNVPLVRGTREGRLSIIAKCIGDRTLRIDHELEFDELLDRKIETATLAIVDRVFSAWGCPDGKSASQALARAKLHLFAGNSEWPLASTPST